MAEQSAGNGRIRTRGGATMKLPILLAALLAAAGLAAAWASGPEAERGAAAAAFEAAGTEIPVSVKANTPLRCTASVRFSTPGWGGRCQFNRVVTEVQLVNGQLSVSCGELEVSCR